MRQYKISIDFGSGLDLRAKIGASLTIRKMIEHLGNRYKESKVISVQDTHCEIVLTDPSDMDISDTIRQELLSVAGGNVCTISIQCDGGAAMVSDASDVAAILQAQAAAHQKAAPQTNSALARVQNLVGANDFKKLCQELVSLSGSMRSLKGKSFITRNTYLFTIDDGYGLTTALDLFAKVLQETKLLNSDNAVEMSVGMIEDEKASDVGDQLAKQLQYMESKVVCLDLTEAQSNLEKPGHRALLRKVAAASESCVLVFRLPYMEQKVLQAAVDILEDIFFLRTVTFVPMDFEDLSICAKRTAEEYGFTLDPNVEPLLAQMVAHEKSDGRFYGIKTIEKLVDRIVYEKLRILPQGAEPTGTITAADLKNLDSDIDDLAELTGEERLNQLIGMEPVAKQIREIIGMIEYSIAHRTSERPSIHMRFVGAPGTGKTTVARIVGQILKEKGILRKGVFFEYEGVDFMAKYVGHTAPKVAQICRDAYGSVLFIDEAYALAVKGDNETGIGDYREEALNTLLSEMENHRDDMVVIMAGYKDEIDDLMRSNPGLVQRMPYEIVFNNYSKEDLAEIFFAQARKDFLFGEEFIEKVRTYFLTLPNNIYLSPTFANARFVRNLFERTMSKAVMRAQLEKADLTTLLPIDFEKAAEEITSSANGAMVFGKDKSGATMFSEEHAKVHFSDVQGEEEAKELLAEIVDFLKNPAKYTSMGARIPHGALLYGPPGTGKTLLAKAVAGESGVPFLSVSGSDLSGKYVGEGADRIRSLFEKARSLAPCIIFIDEIDAIGASRGSGFSSGDTTLIQLLTEMDGFDDKSTIVVMGATNRPELLDAALRRPGRFDRDVPVELPDLDGRVAILNLYLEKVPHDPAIDVNEIARMAAGMSGAELRNVVNEAALMAIREGRNTIIRHDLEESIDITSVGYLKKNEIMDDHDKWVTAYHEIGHAMVTALQQGTSPLQKITIMPRTSGVLGFSQQIETRDSVHLTRSQMEARIAICCAGRAAEELHFNEITTGASNDIERATAMARAIVARYGMTDEFDMVCLVKTSGGYLGGGSSQNCSDETARLIDQKVIEIVRAQHQKAYDLLKANEAKLDELAKFLHDRETITGDEFNAILNA